MEVCRYETRRAVLTTFDWEQGDTHIRTLCEFNLKALEFPDNPHDAEAWLRQWQSAFDVQRVTDDFFRKYERCFYEKVKPAVLKVLGDDADAHTFTQTLFNRLMFCWFLQKKGWLGGSPNYLLHLLDRANRPRDRGAGYSQQANLYHDYLSFLFFKVLSNPEEERRKHQPTDPHVSWEAPFLNGGLFERTPLDERVENAPRLRQLPNFVFERILRDLFSRYNFTVEESTSLDVQVALDPELLGTIFERLVTGRHETGSYYTPRPVVEFMCREALSAYLKSEIRNPKPEIIEDLVYNRSVENLSPADATDIIRALDTIKVCDPACGSGAYLVTMLHELVALYRIIYSEKLKDPKKDYDLKLRIIQRNLYGVDLDPFAVNIARLRLWLSLVVDNEETDWRKVEPLPNLDFKIEVGDSLTAPNPQDVVGGGMFRHRALQLAEGLAQLKGRFLRAHGAEKQALVEQIKREESELAAALKDSGNPPAPDGALDWRVAFAEVFAAQSAVAGGFDIVLTNPPYLRQEVVKRQFGDNYKRDLVRLYPEAYVSTADIYIAFYARAHQLLRQSGIGCFISSNKWLRAGYGEKLRQHLLDTQAFHLVVDFGELPVFQAATFPAIFLWRKQPRDDTPTMWAVVKDLQACYDEGIREHVARIAQTVPASQLGKGKPRLAAPATADRRAKMEASGQRLGELVKGQIYRGIITGLNEAFIIDRATRDRLIAEDRKSVEIIKPLFVGDDVRRYELHFRERYLIWTYIGVPIRQYPAVLEHLKRFQVKAEKRWDQGEYWWELRACDYYAAFDRPKILYPDIGKETRFAMDTNSYYSSNTTYFVAREDWYLLGVLNSASAFEYLKGTCAALGDEEQGGRLRFFGQYLETLPIPDASTAEREAVAKLAQEAQRLHTERRRKVEEFLRDIGIDPAQSSSRTPLEQPWALTPDEFSRRARGRAGTEAPPLQVFLTVRDATAALTEEITKVEREIDARVARLYGL